MKDGKRRRAKALRLPDVPAFQQAASIPVKGQKPLTQLADLARERQAKGQEDMREVRRHLERSCKESGRQNTYGGVFYSYTVLKPKELRHKDNTRTLWHGTALGNLTNILIHGFRPSYGGLMGPGVYFGGRQKAEAYSRAPLGALLRCEVALGRTADAVPSWEDARPPYDTLHGVPGQTRTYGSSTLLNEEWAVLDPARISIHEIRVFTANRGECVRCGRLVSDEHLQSRWSPRHKDFIRLCGHCL